MFKPFATALIVTLSTTLGTAADAAEFNFTAYVYHYHDVPLNTVPRLDIEYGDIITGSFSYDLNARFGRGYETDNGTSAQYEPPVGQVTPSIGQISFNFGPTPTTLELAAISVDDNFLNRYRGGTEDGLHFIADASPIFPAPITGDDLGYTTAYADIYLTGPETVFDSSALPTTLNLEDFFIESSLAFSGHDPAAGTYDYFRATITNITDVTTVDTPLSGLLLASGCMMLWMRRKPNAKQT